MSTLLQAGSTAAMTVETTAPPAATRACGPPRPRVLIVDDSPEDRELYRLDLAPDFEVIEAAGLSDGLVHWRDHAPDCVLLDQRLPDGDGLELIAAARAAGAADVPVVLLTGVADTALAVGAMKAGCADLLVKSSFTGSELRQALRNSLARAALERQVSAQRAQLAHNVEELERALVALRASEARLKLGVQVGALALAEVDYLRDEITLSAEAAALYGLPEADDRPLPRSMLHARFHPDDRAGVMAAIARALDPASDGTLALEHRIVLPAADGAEPARPARVRWIAVRKQVSFDASRSRPVSAMLAARDITPRRLSEERARRSEEQLRLAHVAAGLGEWTWDVDNEVSTWSPDMYEMHGLPPDAPASYATLSTVMLPEDLARVQQRIAEALPTGYYTADYRIRHPQLGLRWIMGIGRVVERDASGQPRRMTGIALDITDRKRMEERLSASEARFVALAQAAPLILYTTDAYGACDFVNARFWEITGLAPHAGPLGLDHLHPDDVPLLRAAWRESRARGTAHEHRFRLRVGGSGNAIEWRWYLTRALPVRDDSGQVQRWVAVAFDVHEELLREVRLQWLVELGDALVGAREPDAVLSAVSRQVGQQLQVARCGTTQIDRGHQVGHISDDWHRPGLASMAGSFNLSVWGDGIVGPLLRGDMIVIRDITTDPRSAAVDASVYAPLGIRSLVSVPLHGEGDAMFQLWVCDDRPREWTQAELLLLEAAAQRAWLALENARLFFTTREALGERDIALQESRHNERFLRQIADTVPEALYLFDLRENRNIYANRKVGDLLGYSADEILARGAEFMPNTMHPDDFPRIAQHLQEMANLPDGTVRSIEYRMRTRDGRWRWFSSSETVWSREDDGRPRVMLGAAQDITERRAAVEALQDASRRKDEFLAMLAHELRNPLAPIRNAVETLQLTHDPGTVTQLSATISRQVQHLARLVDDLLDVSRITQGKIALRLGSVDLASAVQSAVEAVRPLVDSRQHQLVVTPSPQPLTLRADPTRLAQMIGNLLNNAAKYTPPGGRIEIGWTRNGEMAQITVRDNGIGIPREILEQVFDLFVQENRTIDRSQGGLGIGLALVKSLVQMHGGTVTAHSDGSGFGSSFTLRLPLAVAGTPPPPAPPPASDMAPARHLRVLVVDDNVDAAETLALVLRLQGHEAHVETSARGALAAAPQFRPDAVFLDIGLPEIDGYAVARALRADPVTAGALLVALTGYGTDDDRKRARAEGFDAHLTKPADIALIHQLLASTQPSSPAAP